MRQSWNLRRWTRHFVQRTERTTTTWTFRFAALLIIVVSAWVTRSWWTGAIARSLVCDANAAASDALVVENFDTDYLTFERAARLVRAGLAARALVPVAADPNTRQPNAVSARLTDTLIELARLDRVVIVPVREVEPIELNTASDVVRFGKAEGIRSIVVVSPLFRSRRAWLVYQATSAAAGIAVTCEPVPGVRDVNTWRHSWHGIQEVAEQWVKLQYYRFYVLPFRVQPAETTD
jgi:hypothetical protein